MAMGDRAVWVDEREDREAAFHGSSRYGIYVQQRATQFAELWDPDTPFRQQNCARLAWQVGRPPIMVRPPYIHAHERFRSLYLQVGGWNGGLMAVAELATDLPCSLASTREWQAGQWVRDWERDMGELVGPSERDAEEHAYALTTVTYSVPLTHLMKELPEPPTTLASANIDIREVAREAPQLAQDTVRVLVIELDRILRPVIEALELA